MEVEPIELDLAGAAGGDVTEVRLIVEAADPSVGPGAKGDAVLDGGADEASKDGQDSSEWVRRGRVVGRVQVAAGEEPPDAGAHGGEDVRYIGVARWGTG